MKVFTGISALVLAGVLAACSQQAPATKAPETEAAAPAAEAPAAEAETAAVEPVSLNITDASGAQLTGDPTAGQRIFAQCATCHSVDAGVNRVGPSLHNIIGRESGTVPGFRYSAANQASDITWTEQELFTYLENPQAKIPGTIMAFVGLRQPQQRADVIAYLKTHAMDAAPAQ
ncbi:MAG: c-type cytochrome [Alphaproteobacteria bacterium]|nr:c-type cytochrome [Alphaproteobacteria bacterium]